jgi:hypothetical protein
MHLCIMVGVIKCYIFIGTVLNCPLAECDMMHGPVLLWYSFIDWLSTAMHQGIYAENLMLVWPVAFDTPVQLLSQEMCKQTNATLKFCSLVKLKC